MNPEPRQQQSLQQTIEQMTQAEKRELVQRVEHARQAIEGNRPGRRPRAEPLKLPLGRSNGELGSELLIRERR